VYLTVIADTAAPLFGHWFPGKWYADRRFVITLFSVLFVFPLICLKKVSLLSYTSGLAVLSSAYTCAFIVVQRIIILAKDGLPPSVNIAINPSFQILGAFPIITFAFQCHIMLIPIYAELYNPTIGRMTIVIIAALGVCLSLEGTVAIFGYLSFGAATAGNILLNYPMKNIGAGVARVGMGFVAIFAYPMANFTARLTIRSLVFKRDPEFADWKFYTVTVLWFIMTLLIALFVPNISIVFGLTGSLGCTAVMFLFPGLILWVLARDYSGISKVSSRLYAVFLLIFGMIVLLGGTFVSIMEIIFGVKWADKLDWWRK
jgi:sodium-coupled neutral amino acid transporter 7/8